MVYSIYLYINLNICPLLHEEIVELEGHTQQMSGMDQDFKAFLSKKGITEEKYNSGSLDAQAKLVETFEKSKQGKTKHHLFCFIVFTLFVVFSCLLSSCILTCR